MRAGFTTFHRTVLLLSLVVAATALVLGCNPHSTSSPGGLSTYLESLGYSFYNPPRADSGPGSVFRFVRAQSGKLAISPVCRKLFPNLKTERTAIDIPREESTQQLDIDFFSTFLSDLLQDPARLNAQLKHDGAVTANFEDATSIYILEEDLVNANGLPRAITPQCYAALKKLAAQGQMTNNVFIIQDAIQVARATYHVSKQAVASAGGEVAVKSILQFKPGVNYKAKSALSFEIVNPRFVAFKAFLLTAYTDTGLTTEGTAIIKARPLKLSEFE